MPDLRAGGLGAGGAGCDLGLRIVDWGFAASLFGPIIGALEFTMEPSDCLMPPGERTIAPSGLEMAPGACFGGWESCGPRILGGRGCFESGDDDNQLSR